MKILVTKNLGIYVYSSKAKKHSLAYHKVFGGSQVRFYVITYRDKDRVDFINIKNIDNVPDHIDNEYLDTI